MAEMKLTRRSAMFGLLPIAVPRPARAGVALHQPRDRVILTVSGKIGGFNNGTTAQFDREMLEELGTTQFTTSTPWYDGPVTFEGVRMSHLMDVLGAQGDTLIATAMNDYETRIPLSDVVDFNVLMAMKRNGEYMPVRDKGPLFIVYPFDTDPVLKNQRYYGRCAWQLSQIRTI
jgi:hypothetical protein